jgi:hypothetical protein
MRPGRRIPESQFRSERGACHHPLSFIVHPPVEFERLRRAETLLSLLLSLSSSSSASSLSFIIPISPAHPQYPYRYHYYLTFILLSCSRSHLSTDWSGSSTRCIYIHTHTPHLTLHPYIHPYIHTYIYICPHPHPDYTAPDTDTSIVHTNTYTYTRPPITHRMSCCYSRPFALPPPTPHATSIHTSIPPYLHIFSSPASCAASPTAVCRVSLDGFCLSAKSLLLQPDPLPTQTPLQALELEPSTGRRHRLGAS